MKNLFLFIFVLLLSFICLGCTNENHVATLKEPTETVIELEKVYMEMREIAWASLSDTDKETVMGNWKDAKVTEEQLSVNDEVQPDNNPMKVMKVIFNTSRDRFLGPIGIYINPNTNKIISRDVRM
ncbi:hypothetical protein JOC25_002372 [Solibacillus kalamii]|uniref:Uncharacterized protein n=1 Tax=Solibacillus kalamii TaxID=1748298 RepID=A0ABX3ZGM4_9BACL|nr:hypothetical protein [Solibacillus kalamii]MBM7665879.1 hypothetical protein [Solibacillus kalamii]OUZ38686.1 hypothetical protein CBM15_11265 [Solibacillus kalamii]